MKEKLRITCTSSTSRSTSHTSPSPSASTCTHRNRCIKLEIRGWYSVASEWIVVVRWTHVALLHRRSSVSLVAAPPGPGTARIKPLQLSRE
eukprot:4612765-Prymnesium_polylepis.1